MTLAECVEDAIVTLAPGHDALGLRASESPLLLDDLHKTVELTCMLADNVGKVKYWAALQCPLLEKHPLLDSTSNVLLYKQLCSKLQAALALSSNAPLREQLPSLLLRLPLLLNEYTDKGHPIQFAALARAACAAQMRVEKAEGAIADAKGGWMKRSTIAPYKDVMVLDVALGPRPLRQHTWDVAKQWEQLSKPTALSQSIDDVLSYNAFHLKHLPDIVSRPVLVLRTGQKSGKQLLYLYEEIGLRGGAAYLDLQDAIQKRHALSSVALTWMMYGLAAYEKRNLVHGKLDTLLHCYQNQSKQITQAFLCAPVLLPDERRRASILNDRAALRKVLAMVDRSNPGLAFNVRTQLKQGLTLQDCFWQGKLPAYDWLFTMSSASFVSYYTLDLPQAAVDDYERYAQHLDAHVPRTIAWTVFKLLGSTALELKGCDNLALWKAVFAPVTQHAGELRAILAVRVCNQLLDPQVHGFKTKTPSETVVVHTQPTLEWLQQQVRARSSLGMHLSSVSKGGRHLAPHCDFGPGIGNRRTKWPD
jgi:hypothetical protein